jgi:hypothetical protein
MSLDSKKTFEPSQREGSMWLDSRVVFAVMLAGLLLTACSDGSVAPTGTESGQALTASASPTHAIDLTCFAGPCDGAAGQVNVTPNTRPVANAAEGFGFAVEGQFNLRGAPPNTTYLVQRKVDFAVDGVCTGAAYVSFPIPQFAGPLVRLTTSPGGAGAAHFDLQLPGFADGSQFDVTFRLIEESPNANGTELRTGCVTVKVR